MAVDEAKANFQLSMETYFQQAFEYGQKAKRNGWFRVSPYVDDQMRDAYFYAGYDGMTWAELHGEAN